MMSNFYGLEQENLMSQSDGGSLLHARGAATEKAWPPSLARVQTL